MENLAVLDAAQERFLVGDWHDVLTGNEKDGAAVAGAGEQLS
ncbi:hypothetical protein CPter291_0730 [Collimonas pratensis]|uniref:Uncharacterized protein n=1 Tax=Collimonas pratensis TaxID=279113 RepID=A0A127QSJ1_9BURK|nr:hypothetical protein CPter91_0810 [Collimonas pratensis]AMP13014.1 hypothetical protein CPter291_0730 [Collimonas pratensis]